MAIRTETIPLVTDTNIRGKLFLDMGNGYTFESDTVIEMEISVNRETAQLEQGWPRITIQEYVLRESNSTLTCQIEHWKMTKENGEIITEQGNTPQDPQPLRVIRTD